MPLFGNKGFMLQLGSLLRARPHCGEGEGIGT